MLTSIGLPALRQMRDQWLQLAMGEFADASVPKEDILPKTEQLAELAAASGEADDQVLLLVAYQLRITALEHRRNACEDCTRQAVQANDISALDYWSGAVADCELRLRGYRAKIASMYRALLDDGEADGAAILVSALTNLADIGAEDAVGILQTLMDSVTPERAGAIQKQVRRLEMEAAQ